MLGAYVKVFDDDGFVLVPPSEEPRIDAAVTAYLDSGGTRDSLLRLTTLDGAEYVVRASSIRSWLTTTPAVADGESPLGYNAGSMRPAPAWSCS